MPASPRHIEKFFDDNNLYFFKGMDLTAPEVWFLFLGPQSVTVTVLRDGDGYLFRSHLSLDVDSLNLIQQKILFEEALKRNAQTTYTSYALGNGLMIESVLSVDDKEAGPTDQQIHERLAMLSAEATHFASFIQKEVYHSGSLPSNDPEFDTLMEKLFETDPEEDSDDE